MVLINTITITKHHQQPQHHNDKGSYNAGMSFVNRFLDVGAFMKGPLDAAASSTFIFKQPRAESAFG